MKKQLLSIMLVLTMLATLVAAVLPVSAEESEQTTSMLQITSDITVSELNTTERTGNNGQTYVAYDWFIYGECDMIINHPDMGLENQEYSGTFMNVSMRWFAPDYVIEYSDNQETEPWEPGNTYDAKIVLRSLASGEPVDVETIDVRVTVEGLNIESISAEDYSWAPYTPKRPVITVSYKDGTTSNDTSDLGIRYDDEWPTEPGTYDLKMSAVNGKFNCTIKVTVLEIISVTAKPLTYSEFERSSAVIEFTATYENDLTYYWEDMDTPLPGEVGEHTIEVSVFNDTFTVPVSVTVTPSPTTGVWAEGFTWVYDKLTRTLYIKGEGELPASTSSDYNSLPIKNIVIDEGIESFEQWALMGLSGGEYESLIFPSTLKSFPALGIFGSDITINSVIFREGITNITHLPFGVYGAWIENVYVPASVELVDVYSLVASAGSCGSSAVNLYYAGTEEEWAAITVQPKLYFTLRNLYNTDGSLQLFETEGYSFPTNYGVYTEELRTYEVLGCYCYEYENKYEFSVTWVDEDGNHIANENVEIGGSVTQSPEVPTKEGYTGKWSNAGTNVTAPVVITPVYTANTYTVTWVDENGNTVDTETVEYGKDATKTPTVPEKKGFEGKWSVTATEVKADVTISPEYTELITVEDGTAIVPDSVVDVTEGEDVVIDVTDKTEGTETKVDSVVIGTTTVDKITSANTNVEIKLPDATVSFDKDAIGSISEQAGDKDVTIVATEILKESLNLEQITALEEKEVHAVLNLEAYAGETQLTQFGGGKVTVSVPFELPEGKEGSEYYVAYIANDGTMTVMPTSYANGVLTFETTHFSSYVVLEVEEDNGAPETGDSTNIALFVMLMAACGIALTACVAKRKAF